MIGSNGTCIPETPVPEAAGQAELESDLGTTADVHLYADPGTRQTPTPILFADCEGSHGGCGLKAAEQACQDSAASPSEDKESFVTVEELKGRNPLVSRTIPAWQCQLKLEGKGRSTRKNNFDRSEAINYIYPQFLYSVSNTIVYVTKNHK